MPEVLNPDEHVPDQALVNMLKGYMQAKQRAEFQAIRDALPAFQNFTDGEIQQVAQDADLETAYP